MQDETDLLNDPLWRLQNLYWIKSEEEGRSIPFEPRPEQLQIIRSLLEHPEETHYVIKSRRLGMSTAIGLLMADLALWNSGFQGSLVDLTQSDAERKMSEIIRFGVKSLPKDMLERLKFPKENDGELQIVLKDDEEEEDDESDHSSRIFAGKNARGGNNNMLWISEWGKIAATDLKRSNEIRTGALPSARRGRKVIETTWYGGKGGDLWELLKPVLEKDPNAAGRMFFFPWHGDPACVKATGVVGPELEEYFRELGSRLGKKFTPDQKRWYAAAKVEQGIFVKREYPSTLEEAMTAPVEGAIYGDLMTRAREEGRVKPYLVDGSALVHTFWDEGAPRNTAVWYAQFVGGEIRLIDCDCEMDLTPVERVAHMLRKGYTFGNHYMTHAAQQTETSGKTRAVQFEEAGLTGIKIVPRTRDMWIGINEVRQQMPRMIFRVSQCERGIEALDCYHTKRGAGAVIIEEPVHDWSSHIADALRTLAEANMAGMIAGGSSVVAINRRLAGLRPRVKAGYRGGR